MSDKIEISKGGVTVSLDMIELKETLTSEQRMRLAQDLCWDEVLNEAKMRLASNSECWSGDDNSMSFEFLKEQIIDNALAFKFGAFDRVRQKIKDCLFDNRLYWAAIHDRTPIESYATVSGQTVGEIFRQWFERNGFEDSNYCDKKSDEIANDIILKFECLVKNELRLPVKENLTK